MKSKIHWYYGCGRGRPYRGDISPGLFLSDASKNPDWFCVTCAAKARLALAKESAPKPDAVVWPKPRPISEAPKNGTEIQGFEPDIGWRVVAWTFNAWRLCGGEEYSYNPTHFLPLPPEVR